MKKLAAPRGTSLFTLFNMLNINEANCIFIFIFYFWLRLAISTRNTRL
jgi:hypothetical protein